ncbi:SLC13 family permease [Alkalibaculum sp. M08DMB]|uniref:SLC13 family permease n=1 Tax=Alkalibaculum sporogenes TaxID=2655001 RepID=A0A6A7KBJ3_9FIRM|nr:SLC13 family permease [Alkalibaculum sporogenes]MPW26557.1 SLC13 family permease [Alkalibaculum sporogenes]
MSKKSLEKSLIIKWAIVIILPLVALFIPTGEVYTAVIKNFSIITLFAILIFGTEVMPNVIASLLLPVFYIILEVAPPSTAFAGWLGPIPWMVLGGLLMARIMLRTGILNRLAYSIIVRTGGTYMGLLLGIMISGVIAHILIPGKAMYPFSFITFGLCVALGYGKSLESSGIMLTGLFSTFVAHYFIYNPTYGIIQGIAANVGDTTISWFQYFYHNLPYVLYLPLLIFIIGKVCKPKQAGENPKEYAQTELKKMGKMNIDEKKSLFISILLLAFLLTESLHKVNASWGFLFAGVLFYFPGIQIGTDEDLKEVNYGLIIFVSACLSIGSVANAIGIGQILANTIIPLIQGFGSLGFFIIVFFVLLLGNFVMTPLGLYAALTVPLAQIGASLGISTLAVSYAIMNVGTEVILPYEWALGLMFFSFNLIDLKSFVKLFSIKAALSLVFLIVITIPYWKLIGLVP